MSENRLKVFKFLAAYILRRGFAPSYAVIAKACGYASAPAVYSQINTLELKGYIRRQYVVKIARGIELTEKGKKYYASLAQGCCATCGQVLPT